MKVTPPIQDLIDTYGNPLIEKRGSLITRDANLAYEMTWFLTLRGLKLSLSVIILMVGIAQKSSGKADVILLAGSAIGRTALLNLYTMRMVP